MLKHLKGFFSRTKKAFKLNLGIQNWGIKVSKVYSNDDTRMIFDLFTVWSNLCPSCCGNTREAARYLQMCCSCFYQVSESWPIGFLFLIFNMPVQKYR